MLDALYILLLGAFMVAAYMGAGRLMLIHAHSAAWSTPFNSLLTGIGIWYVWFLTLHVTLGAGITLVWWLFVACVAGLMVVMTKAHRLHENTARFFWPIVLVVLVITLPAFFYLTDDVPMLWLELSHIVKNAHHTLMLDRLPTGQDINQYFINPPKEPMAFTAAVLPVSIMAGKFIPSVYALMGLTLIGTLAGQLVRSAGVHLGWHNVVLATALALIGITALNPFFTPELVFSAYPDVMIALVLFSICLPLMLPEPIPRGVKVLPIALMLTLLVGLKSTMFFPFMLVLAFWIVRAFFDYRELEMKDFFGWSLMAFMPIIGWLMWQRYLAANGFSGAETPVLNQDRLLDIFLAYGQSFANHPAAAVLVVIMLAFGLSRLFTIHSIRSLRLYLIDESPITFPTLMTLMYLVGYSAVTLSHYGIDGSTPGESPWLYLVHLQFILLLPLWMWFMHWYTSSGDTRSWVASAPVTFALIAVLVVIGGVVASKNNILIEPEPPLDHTYRVAKTMQVKEYVPWGEKVAVLDSFQSRGYYSAALGYGLRHANPVQPAIVEFAQSGGGFLAFHDALVNMGADYLWVHAPTAAMRAMMGSDLSAKQSYLFKVVPEGINFVAAFPHSTYTQTDYNRPY